MRRLTCLLTCCLVLGAVPGCVIYEPYPSTAPASPNNFERAWYASLAAAQDAGITLSSQGNARPAA